MTHANPRLGKTVKLTLAAIALALTTGACANQQHQYGTKEVVGTLGGAALGGFLGSQVGSGKGQLAATGAGVLLGAFLGNQIGSSLDQADRMYAERASRQATAAPVGETIAWSNPDSGNYGTVTPVRDGTGSRGEYCREFQQTIYIGGQPESGYGVACRQPDGSWEIVQ